MNAQWWPVIGIIISSMVGYLTARLGARAENKRRSAEAHLFEAQAQEIITKGWNSDLERRDVKITTQENKITALEQRLEAMESDLQDALEQNEIQAEQLEQERRKNRLLTQTLETAQARLRAALAEVDTLKEQLQVARQQQDILTEHAKRVDDWWHRFIRENGSPRGMQSPPTLAPFAPESEEETP